MPRREEEAFGRARRFALEDGRELWRLPESDVEVAERLLALGEEGIGGFELGGIDEEGPWLCRDLSGQPLAEFLGGEAGAVPPSSALRVAAALASALERAERRHVFPGPLSPRGVLLRELGARGATRAVLVAEPLVAVLVGAASRPASGERSPLWTPPEQAEGALWDATANRYVLSVALYVMLAGEHPFGGAGLRHALAESARGEAPPFAEARARALPAGLQALTLRALASDPARRPRSASEIRAELERFLREVEEGGAELGPREGRERADSASGRRGASEALERATLEAPERPEASGSLDALEALRARRKAVRAASREEKTAASRAPFRRLPPGAWRARALLVSGGLAGALAAASLGNGDEGAERNAAPSPASRAPVETALDPHAAGADECAACHARQASEWHRSVMAHAVKSPLFGALESLIEEQVGRDAACPNGAGILRRAGAGACRDPASGVTVTGSGGEHWCVNCHAPAEKLGRALPPWQGAAGSDPRSRLPVLDLLDERAQEGISCVFCHAVGGPAGRRGSGGYEGNPTWTSPFSGAVFSSRPEDARGLLGIANSGYALSPTELFLEAGASDPTSPGAAPGAAPEPRVHRRPGKAARDYLRSSEFCGSCHDVRLFGTDALGAAHGERFKRLRNAYTEWSAWARAERAKGREAASCQDCHMSAFPGVCEPAPAESPPGSGSRLDATCPEGTRFSPRPPGARPEGRISDHSPSLGEVSPHYFSGVDLPLSRDFAEALADEATLDRAGIPLGARRRRDQLLASALHFELGEARRAGRGLEVPVSLENVGAGHRIPAGFSQEREFWVHLRVEDGRGRVLYEVGRVDRPDEDLRDKVFVRVGTDPDRVDAAGRPVGLFGADVRDGPDAPRWSPPPSLGGTRFRGQGLVNLQNGFLRCVRCIGIVTPEGECEPGPGQGLLRADRYEDGAYDLDTGACDSNLSGEARFFETYFPVGALDASRGLVKGPDAIIDTRSAPPGVRLEYVYDLETAGRPGPFAITARLLFRAFPPFLVRAFADYEREQARRGRRPGGPQVTPEMLSRLEVVELARATARVR